MPDRSQRFLERALIFSWVIHFVAMGSMALLLLPAMPGGPTADDGERMRRIAEHPWLWRLGWVPWQVTALSDLLIGVALLRTKWVPKLPALATLVITVAAVIPDQAGELGWMTRGVDLAQTGNLPAYLAFENRVFMWTAVWGGTLYTLMAVGWSACFAMGKCWSGGLTALSAILWPLFLYVNAGPLLPQGLKPSAAVVAGGNAVAFLLLQVWTALVLERLVRRVRPDTAHGRYAPWRHPNHLLGLALDPLASSRFVRALTELAPPLVMVSDITDVIYVNYLVDAARLEPLVPPGLELQRVGHLSVFSFLTFRHGHFGPRLLGPLRALLPGPIHTNWRIHVRDPRTKHEGVYFVTNAIASTPHALGARFMSEGMPMHVLASAELTAAHGGVRFRLNPGGGSAPDADAELSSCPVPEKGPWSAAFATWRDALAYIVPQDRALTSQPWHRHITRQEILLDIPLEACEPLDGRVTSQAAAAIVGESQPFSFRVPSVRFLFESELCDLCGN